MFHRVMKTTIGILASFVLLSGMLVSGNLTFADSTCDAASEARTEIESLDRKYSELKKKAYSEWEAQTRSGVYSGTWDEYAQKFLGSAEIKEIQILRQKYAEIDQKCAQYSTTKMEYSDTKKKTCDTADYKNIKKIFFAIEQKLVAAKEKHYKDWETQTKSGTYSGTWDQYSKEKFQNSQEMLEYQKAQAKHGTMIQYCQSNPQPETKTLQLPVGCNESEFESAKKALNEYGNKASLLKEKLYSEWKTLTDAGKISESWGVYFNQRFDTAPEVQEWRILQDKFSGIMHTCTPTNDGVIQSNTQPIDLNSSLLEKKVEKTKFSKKKTEFDKQDKLTKAKKTKKAKVASK
jgi:hypothetical protein